MRISDWSSDVCSSDLLSDSYSEGGGTNWALTWTSYLTDNLSMKLMHGRTERTSVSGSPNDVDCNYVSAGGGVVDAGVPLGCTNNLSVYDRTDEREQTRADFEWLLGDHLLRFGYDARSEERRVGKEGVSTCRYRGSRYH